MNPHAVREQLQSLPPDLPVAPDRFDRVHALARRRRDRRRATAAAACAAVIAASPLLLNLNDTSNHRQSAPPAAIPSTPPAMQPGGDEVTRLSEPRVYEGMGAEVVDLGRRPPGATSVETTLTCLSAGTITWPDGASMVCSPKDLPSSGIYDIDLDPGQDSIALGAREGVRWRVETTYVRKTPTAWGVNAKGDTYGVRNDQGVPDLIAVEATNGTSGYVYSQELESATRPDVGSPEEARLWMKHQTGTPTRLPVYESDGKTVIGEFVIGYE